MTLDTSRIVVPDASELIDAFFNRTNSARAFPLLAAIRLSEVEAVAPSLLITEFIGYCARCLSGSSAFPFQTINAIVEDFLELPILYVPSEEIASAAWQIFRPGGIELPDAFYVAVAMQWNAELWTSDRGLFSQALPVYFNVHNLNAKTFAL